MDWFKSKAKYYLLSPFTDDELGKLSRLQAMIAFHERILLEHELDKILKKKRNKIETKLQLVSQLSLRCLQEKVMEDVLNFQQQRKKSAQRMRGLRSKTSNVTPNVRQTFAECSREVTLTEKRREDREDKRRDKKEDMYITINKPYDDVVNPPIDEINSSKVMTAWNSFSKDNSLKCIRSLSQRRRSGVTARIRQSGFNLQEVLDAIKASDFCCGKNNRGWKVDFDWVFCSESNWLKLVEGKYENQGANGNQSMMDYAKEIMEAKGL